MPRKDDWRNKQHLITSSQLECNWFNYSRCSTWKERKEFRKKHFEKYIKGWKLRNCLCCMGTGEYDHNGSPKCEGCGGYGVERFKK